MNDEELKLVEEIIKSMNITRNQKLQILMPKIDTFLLYAILTKLNNMDEKILRILQEVD